MRYRTITYEVTGQVAIISLNRPEVRNCISLAVTTELDEAFTATTPSASWCFGRLALTSARG